MRRWSPTCCRRGRRRSGYLLVLSLALAAAPLLRGSSAAVGGDAIGLAGPGAAAARRPPSSSSSSAAAATSLTDEASSSTAAAALAPSSSSSSSQPIEAASSSSCTASTGRELVIALATPACKVITLTGVITVYDADFAGIDREAGARAIRLDGDGGFARATPVVLRSAVGFGAEDGSGSSSSSSFAAGKARRADAAAAAAAGAATSSSSSWHHGGGVGGGGGANGTRGSLVAARAALEAATRLTLHIDVPKGVVVELLELSLAGVSAKAPSSSSSSPAKPTAADRSAGAAVAGGGSMFSIFHVHAGGEIKLMRCDLRAKRGMCSGVGASSKGEGAAAATASAAAPLSSSLSSSPSSVGGAVDTALLLAADPQAQLRRVENGNVVIERATVDPLALFGNARRSPPPASAVAKTVQQSLPRKLSSFSSPPPSSSSSSPSSASASSPASPPASSSFPSSSLVRLVITDTAIWCPETGFIRAGRPSAPGEGRVSVSSRVWTPLELSSALGSAGSRTVLCEDDLVLPRAGHGRPAALVQDRDVVFRAAEDAAVSDGGEGKEQQARRRPVRLSCLHEPGARDCVFPVVAAGSGGSVSFEGLSIEAPDPGCPVEPATRCSYRGRQLPYALRGTLTPAGAVGVSNGGWLVFSGVELSYDFCTAEFEQAVQAVVEEAASGGAAAEVDGVKLVRASGGGGAGRANGSSSTPPPPLLTFSCARCDFDCSLPGAAERGELPATFSLRNTTITCARPLPASLRKRAGTGVRVGRGGGGDAGMPEGALASSPSSPSSHASTKLSTAALAATLAAGGAAVAAAALGAALGARTVARRAAAAEAAGGSRGSSGGSERERERESDGFFDGDDDDNERARVSLSSANAPTSTDRQQQQHQQQHQQQKSKRPWWQRVLTPSAATTVEPNAATSSSSAAAAAANADAAAATASVST